MIRYAKLPILFDALAAKKELTAINEEWVSHFNKLHYEGSWTALSLRSPGGHHYNIVPELMSFKDYNDTAYMAFFPSIKNLLTTLNCTVMSVRLLNLQTGAVIKPHADHELCFEKGEVRLHFPIATNPQVEFYIDNDRIVLNECDCWYINANLIHSVANRGVSDRIHLVIDCRVNDWLKDLMDSAIEISSKPDFTASELQSIISELRLHNNPASSQLAFELEQQLIHRQSH